MSVLLNQITAIAISVFNAVWTLPSVSFYDNMWIKAAQIVYVIYFAGVITFIVCVESRLDSFRSDRETAGWSEEKGYPENYVHESDIKRDD